MGIRGILIFFYRGSIVRAFIFLSFPFVFTHTAWAGDFQDAGTKGGNYQGSYIHGDSSNHSNDVYMNSYAERMQQQQDKEAKKIVASYRKDVAGKSIANQDPDLVLAEAQRFVRLTEPQYSDGPGKAYEKDSCAPSATAGYTMVCTLYAYNQKSKSWVPSVYLFKHITVGSIKDRVKVSTTAVAVNGTPVTPKKIPTPNPTTAPDTSTGTPSTSLATQSLANNAGQAGFCYGVECFTSWGGSGRAPAGAGFAKPAAKGAK
jgi:hypothetical protein